MQTRFITITGRVQSVGFRPFVNRLADRLQLYGWVQNHAGIVEICIQGSFDQLDLFVQYLLNSAPPLALIETIKSVNIKSIVLDSFTIKPSIFGDNSQAQLTPDYFMCRDCLAEMQDKNQRRYRYPFINCTQCGPRYTLIERLPYDRANTSMADFPLCAECRKDYENPLDRRYHAQALACAACGPKFSFRQTGHLDINVNEAAMTAAVVALQAGQIIAVKGIGGYHLLCSAKSESAVTRLRDRKHRHLKPLAVMLPWSGEDGLDYVWHYTKANSTELKLLANPLRPIVLVEKRKFTDLAKSIAPGMTDIGVMLPYSPLHFLLLQAFGAPVIATSANISGEPVLIDADQIESRLASVADGFLHHNRTILRPADDSIFRVIANKAQPIRLGRGYAPLEFRLPFNISSPLLALGAQMKNTVALAWDNRVIVSPYIGDLDSPRSLQVFEQTITDLTKLYGITVKRCVCDAHPDYSASRWAENSGLSVHKVFHHHAHASALVAEHQLVEPMLVFTWDGTGYGEDGTLWGGEGLFGKPGTWQRVSSFRPFRLPGAEQVAREPWRSALALCWEINEDWPECLNDTELLKQAWQKQLNTPLTSSVGRLFDAAAALTGLVHKSDFEGHAAMWLEAFSKDLEPSGITLSLTQNAENCWLSDWQPLVSLLKDQTLSIGTRSESFHASLAMTIVEQAQQIRTERGDFAVGLTGGVFQNKYLTELAMNLLQDAGFKVYLPERIPANDAGISFGQIIEVAMSSHKNTL